jgi:uncharacterized protein (TIRG00374 family)
MTEESKSNSPGFKWKTYGVRLIGLVLFVVIISKVDLRKVGAAITCISFSHFLLAVLLCFGIVVVKGLRWLMLLQALGVTQTFTESVRVSSDAIFWGTITPGRLGEWKRIFYLTRQRGMSLVRGTVVCIIDRGFDLLALLLVLIVVSFLAPNVVGGFVPREAVVGIAIVCGCGLAFRRQLTRNLQRFGDRWLTAKPYLVEVTTDVAIVSHTRIVLLAVLSILSFFFYVMMVWALALGMPFSLGPLATTLAVALTMLAGLIPISFFNLGPRELILLGLFALYGLSKENAISFSFLFLLCYLILMFSSFTVALAAKRWAQATA